MRYARYALASTVALTLLGSLSCSKKPTPSDPSRDIKEQQPEDDNGVRAPKPATLSDVTFYEDLNKPTTMSVTLIDGSPQKEGSGGALARHGQDRRRYRCGGCDAHFKGADCDASAPP